MSVKDKVIFGLMFLLILGGVYVQYNYTQIMDRMDKMEQEQLTHVKEVNEDFAEQLRVLNLQFIGRGKHLQQAQKDIIANTELIDVRTDSLIDMINEVDYALRETNRKITKEFASLNQDIDDIRESVSGLRRRTTEQLLDLDQKLTTIRSDIKKLNDKVFEKEGSE